LGCLVVFGEKEEITISPELLEEILTKSKLKENSKLKHKVKDLSEQYNLPSWFISHIKKEKTSYGYRFTPSPSKTDIFTIDGLQFFIYNNKTKTINLAELYVEMSDGNYMLLIVLDSNEKAKLFAEGSIGIIKDKMSNISDYKLVSRNDFDKPEPKEEKNKVKVYTMPTVEELQDMHNRILNELDV